MHNLATQNLLSLFKIHILFRIVLFSDANSQVLMIHDLLKAFLPSLVKTQERPQRVVRDILRCSIASS